MEFTEHAIKLFQIILVDLILAGDNAIVIGLVAAKFSKEYRKKVILYGVGVAVALRIIFALITVQLLAIKGLLLVGGILLFWVCWKLWSELRSPDQPAMDMSEEDTQTETKNPPMLSAVFHIVMADVSMSLDNVLAVAGIADGHHLTLVFGLALSVVFMTVAASLIANILQKHRWIGYLGLAVIVYVAAEMSYKGYHQLVV